MTDKLIETIAAAVAPEATPTQRQAGAEACRTLLAVLEARPGEPMRPPSAPAPAPMATPAIAGMQFLELLVAKLQAGAPKADKTADEPTSTDTLVPQRRAALSIPFVPLGGLR